MKKIFLPTPRYLALPLHLALLFGLVLSGCSLAPTYVRPEMPVTSTWPEDIPAKDIPTGNTAATGKEPKTRGETGDTSSLSPVPPVPAGWKIFFTEPELQNIIVLALANNRDLRTTALNIERARGMYQIQRADLVPGIGLSGTSDNTGTPASLSQSGQRQTVHQQSLSVGFNSYELDFFGRIRSLKNAALEEFLGTEEAYRAGRISLVSQVAAAYVAVLADQERLDLARNTLQSQQATYTMIKQRFEVGTSSELDLRQAQTSVETARVDIAKYEGQVGMDFAALSLLAGAPVTREMLPSRTLAVLSDRQDLPVGLPSAVLLQRPDILQAEHTLKAANANIGAARANFFPRISLTAGMGSASTELANLLASGSGAWSLLPSVTLPLFEAGKNVGTLRVAEADKELAVAAYEKAIQTAFREVSDALIKKASVARQFVAQKDLTEATAAVYKISSARYAQGVDSYLTVLDSQRALYNAQRDFVTVQTDKELSSIELYKVLGYGWKE